jgi:D-Ala-D-Ala carboxypeptidase 3 (S13) family
VVSLARPRFTPATRPGSGRRRGERRGPHSARVGVRDGRQGNELVAQNTDAPFVPASVTKIVTAWLAMEVLGGDYRFKTPGVCNIRPISCDVVLRSWATFRLCLDRTEDRRRQQQTNLASSHGHRLALRYKTASSSAVSTPTTCIAQNSA